jgi:hypothetical protein
MMQAASFAFYHGNRQAAFAPFPDRKKRLDSRNLSIKAGSPPHPTRQ